MASSASYSTPSLQDIPKELQVKVFNEVMTANEETYTVGIARYLGRLNGEKFTLPPTLASKATIPPGYIPVVKRGYDAALLSGTTTPTVFPNENQADEIHVETSLGTSQANRLNLLTVSEEVHDIVKSLCKPASKPGATLFMQYAHGPMILEALVPNLMDHVKTVVIAGTHDGYRHPAGFSHWAARPDMVYSGFPGAKADAHFENFVEDCFGPQARWPHVQKMICRNYYPFAYPMGALTDPELALAGIVCDGGENGYSWESEIWMGRAGTCGQITVSRPRTPADVVCRQRIHMNAIMIGATNCALTRSLMRYPGACVVDSQWPGLAEFPCDLDWDYYMEEAG